MLKNHKKKTITKTFFSSKSSFRNNPQHKQNNDEKKNIKTLSFR